MILGAVVGLAFIVASVAAWITHIVWTINVLLGSPTFGEIAIGVIGIMFAPLGMIHGLMIWF